MIIITDYSQDKKDGKTFIHSKESSHCPICGSKLKVIGSRKRMTIGTDGIQQTYVIRRLRCVECGQIHHELPDTLVPYKRHCAETIEDAISEKEPQDTAGNVTMKRLRNWWSNMSFYFYNVIASLEAKYDVNFPTPIKPREIVRAVVNTHLWSHTRSVRLSNQR